MNIGFVILCPNSNVRELKATAASIRRHCYDRRIVAMIPTGTSMATLREMKTICSVHRGKDTLTSLINGGMRWCDDERAFILFAGSKVSSRLEHKLDEFCRSENDVLFPIIEGKWTFVDGSFDGVSISKTLFKQAGEFQNQTAPAGGLNDFQMSKLLWADQAVKHKALFKAVMGLTML